MKKVFTLLIGLLITAGAMVHATDVECTSIRTGTSVNQDTFYLALESSEYYFVFAIECQAGVGDIVNGQTYTLANMNQNNSYGIDWNLFAYIMYSSVSLVRDSANRYSIDITDTNGNSYHVTYAPPVVITTAKDSVAITINNEANRINNAMAEEGYFQLYGYDQAKDYNMLLSVMSDTIAGTYGLSDISVNGSYIKYDGKTIYVSNVRNITVTGTTQAANANIEVIGRDSILYKITFVYPGIFVPVPITDTVEISMEYLKNSYIYDETEYMGYFQINANNTTTGYSFGMLVQTDSFAGVHSNLEIYNFSLYRNENTIEHLHVNDFTIISDSIECSTVIEVIGADHKMYRISFAHSFVPLTPVDTVDIKMNVSLNNYVEDDTSNGSLLLQGSDANNDYNLSLTVFTNSFEGIFTEDDISSYNSYLKTNTKYGLVEVPVYEFRSVVVTGSATLCHAWIEILDINRVLYRITYVYSETPIVPTDTVDVTMTSNKYNMVYDHISESEQFVMKGTDISGQYVLSMCVMQSEQMEDIYSPSINDIFNGYYTLKYNGKSIGIDHINTFYVYGTAQACSTTVEIVSYDSVLYRIAYSYTRPQIVATDTVAITLDNADYNTANCDYLDYGYFFFEGADDNEEYEWGVAVESSTFAGTHASSAIYDGSCILRHNGIELPIYQMSSLTVTGTPKACTAYMELLASDSTLYQVNFSYTFVAPEPVNIVDVNMVNKPNNALTDRTASNGYFQIYGESTNSMYRFNMTVRSNQLAGSYTQDDVTSIGLSYNYSGLLYNYIEIRNFTVTGNADTLTTHIEVLANDLVLYRVDYTYIYVPIIPVDTIEITIDNGSINAVDDYVDQYNYLGLYGADLQGDYTMYLSMYISNFAGNYTQDEVGYFELNYQGNSISIMSVNSVIISGTADSCSVNIELLSDDTVLYRIYYTYPGIIPPITPIDTVEVTLNDWEYNIVYDYTSDQKYYCLRGSDQNNTLILNLTVDADNFNDSCSFKDVYKANSTITYNSNTMLFYSMKDFVMSGDATNCSTYLEIIGVDSVLYKLTYVYPGEIMTPVRDTVDITMDNRSYNSLSDLSSDYGMYQFTGADAANIYNFNATVLSYSIDGNFTKNSLDLTNTWLTYNSDTIVIDKIAPFTVTGDASNMNTYLQILSADSVLYRITYAYPGVYPPITPVDTIALLINNGRTNRVADYTMYGQLQLLGETQDRDYYFGITLNTYQVAGSYTSDDLQWGNYTWLKYYGERIDIRSISDFTIVGDADSCSTYLEIVSMDSVLYQITYQYPGYLPPITPIDTVDITMTSPNTAIYDLCWTQAFYQLEGLDQAGEYLLRLAVNSNQVAGSYTKRDIKQMYTGFMHYVGNDTMYIDIYEVKDFTVVGDMRGCSTYVEMLSADSVLYRVNYVFAPDPIVTPVDTIYITMHDSTVNRIFDYITSGGYVQLSGYDSDNGYMLQVAINTNSFAGTYSHDDIYNGFLSFTNYNFSGLGTICLREMRSMTLTGTPDSCSAIIELMTIDSYLFVIDFKYHHAQKPVVDTVVITMNNAAVNRVYDYTQTNSYFTIVGAEQSRYYNLQLEVYSNTFAGTYNNANVYDKYSALYYADSGDTTYIDIAEYRSIVVTGTKDACQAYIEIISTDSVLFKIYFTYTATPTATDDADDSEYIVYNEGSVIVVNGAEGETMALYDMTGKMIMTKEMISDVERIDVGVPGIYLVRIGMRGVKVLVK